MFISRKAQSKTMDSLPTRFGNEGTIGEPDDSIYSKYLRSGFSETKTDVKNDSENDSDSDSDSDDEGKEHFPTSHELPLNGHSKKINSLKFSNSGNRLFTTGADYNLSIYDFNSMNPAATTPFKSSEVYESQPIIKIDLNKKSEILTIPNGLSFKVLDADGDALKEFSEGDRYIYDVKTTRGHTDVLTDGVWNPVDQTKFSTSSNDSTFRLWDLGTGKQEKINFIKCKGKKTKISNVLYTTSSKSIMATDSDSRITLWDVNGNFNRPTKELQLNGTITSINTNLDDENSVLVRTTNNDLKLYDLRNFTNPVIQRLDFPTADLSSATSYHGQFILAGTSFQNQDRDTELHILDKSDLVTLETLSFSGSITALDWNKTIDQVAVGTNSGGLSVLFSPDSSKNGAKITINNKPKKRHFDENEAFVTSTTSQVGYNMNELAELNKSKKKRNGDEEDLKPKQKFIWGTTDAEKIENNINLEDPREALKKFASKK